MNLTEREQLLVALGAALGSNCVPCIESILPKARAIDIPDADLREAVDLADLVRRRPTRKVLDTAREMLSGHVPEEEGTCPLESLGTGAEDRACCG